MPRVRIISRNRRFGPVEQQRQLTGECDFEHDKPVIDLLGDELRKGDVVAVSHALILGKFHAREKSMAFIAERGATVSVGTADAIDVAMTKARARIHELAVLPTGHGSLAQKRNAGAPRAYPRAEGERLELVQEWWAGPLQVDTIRDYYAKLMRCKKPSRAWLISEEGLGLGKRPPHPDRIRKPRSDKGQKKS